MIVCVPLCVFSAAHSSRAHFCLCCRPPPPHPQGRFGPSDSSSNVTSIGVLKDMNGSTGTGPNSKGGNNSSGKPAPYSSGASSSSSYAPYSSGSYKTAPYSSGSQSSSVSAHTPYSTSGSSSYRAGSSSASGGYYRSNQNGGGAGTQGGYYINGGSASSSSSSSSASTSYNSHRGSSGSSSTTSYSNASSSYNGGNSAYNSYSSGSSASTSHGSSSSSKPPFYSGSSNYSSGSSHVPYSAGSNHSSSSGSGYSSSHTHSAASLAGLGLGTSSVPSIGTLFKADPEADEHHVPSFGMSGETIFPYTASPHIVPLPVIPRLRTTLSPSQSPMSIDEAEVGTAGVSSAVAASTSVGGAAAAAAMITMSTSPPLHGLVGGHSPTQLGLMGGAHAGSIPSLDAFPGSAASAAAAAAAAGGSKSSLSASALGSLPSSRSPVLRFQLGLHSPTHSPTFNHQSPSLPPSLSSALDLRLGSHSPMVTQQAGGRAISSGVGPHGPVSLGPSAHHSSHAPAGHSGATSLLLATPSVSFLRANPPSPSGAAVLSFLKSPMMSSSPPNAAAATAGGTAAAGSALKLEPASSSGSAAASGSVTAGSTPTASPPAKELTLSSVSHSSAAAAAAAASSSLSMASPNLSILHRLKTLNQSGGAAQAGSSGPSSSPAPAGLSSHAHGSSASASPPPIAGGGAPNPNLGPKRAPNTGGPPTGPDYRKRPRDVYETGSGSAPPPVSDCINCAQCAAIAASRAAAAAAAAANAPSYMTNPYPSTPFATSTPHPSVSAALHASHHPSALLKSPTATSLLLGSAAAAAATGGVSFTPPIFPVSMASSTLSHMLLTAPASTLLSSHPTSTSRRNSIAVMNLSPALRPLTGSPMMGSRSLGGSAASNATSAQSTVKAGEQSAALSALSASSKDGMLDNRASPSPSDSMMDGPTGSILSSSVGNAMLMASPLLGPTPTPPTTLLCHQCGQHRPIRTIVFCCNAFPKKSTAVGAGLSKPVCNNKYCEGCLATYPHTTNLAAAGAEVGERKESHSTKPPAIRDYPPASKRHDINSQWECPGQEREAQTTH